MFKMVYICPKSVKEELIVMGEPSVDDNVGEHVIGFVEKQAMSLLEYFLQF